MIDFNQIKTDLKISDWQETDQAAILVLLPSLQNFAVEFLADKLAQVGSRFEGGLITQALKKALSVVDDLKSGHGTAWKDLLTNSLTDRNLDFGRYILPVVLDYCVSVNKFSNTEVDFFCKLIQDLPFEGLLKLFENNFLEVVERLDIVEEIKNYFYSHGLSGDKTASGKIIDLIQKKNKELFGQKPLLIDDKQYPQVLLNWITDYTQFSNISISQHSSFEDIQYLERSVNARNLSKEEQVILLEIIKFYRWLQNPSVSRQEIYILKDKFNLLEEASKARKLNKFVYSQSMRLDNKVENVQSPVKKINLDEILSQGSGMRMTQINQVAKPATPPVIPNRPIARPVEQKPAAVKKIPPEIPRAAREPLIKPSDAPGQPQDLGQIRKEIEAKKQLAQKAIDRRLGELKNRKTLPKKQV